MSSRFSVAKRFLGKHKNWLAVVGAAIVFVTFVVNDVLRDNASGLAASLNRALVLSELRNDTSQILTTAGQTEQLVHALSVAKDAHPSTDENAAWVRQGSQGTALELASIQELAQKALPDDSTLSEELQLVAKQIDVDEQIQTALLDVAANPNHLSSAQFATQLTTLFERRPKDPDEFTPIPDSQTIPQPGGGTVKIPLFGYQRLQYDTLKLFVIVRGKEERDEHRAKDWKYISFILYPVGWIIGAVGKLFGVNTERCSISVVKSANKCAGLLPPEPLHISVKYHFEICRLKDKSIIGKYLRICILR
jgi:hypothetical protein